MDKSNFVFNTYQGIWDGGCTLEAQLQGVHRKAQEAHQDQPEQQEEAVVQIVEI